MGAARLRQRIALHRSGSVGAEVLTAAATERRTSSHTDFFHDLPQIAGTAALANGEIGRIRDSWSGPSRGSTYGVPG